MLNREDNKKTEDEEAEEEKKPHSNVLCPHYLLFAQKLTNYLQECIISFIPTLVGLGQVHNINTLHVDCGVNQLPRLEFYISNDRI